MAANRSTPTARDLVRLFDAGSLGAHSDLELLACVQAGDGPIAHEAFRILVERHGPMVLGLCRSIVRDQHEAEDAFQATFLVLVRKAASIERTDTLGPWLHGVASRVARRARKRLFQRRNRELRVISDIPGREQPSPDRSSIEELLHEEIAKLPGSFRRPLILCCLQGLSYRLAAERLGCKEPTLRGRLERAKKRLMTRLEARGISPMLAAPALESTHSAMSPLPPSLVESTVQFALRWSSVTGLIVGGTTVPASISALAQGVIQSMLFQSVRLSAVAFFAAGAIGTVVLAQQGRGPITRPQEAPKPARNDIELIVAAKANADRLDEKTAQIQKKLDMPINAKFPDGATLSQLLKHIKQSTTDATFPGIPIYVDPVGLAEANRNMTTEIKLDYTQQPIRTILNFALRANGLAFEVRDGFLRVSSRTAILESRVEDIDRKLDRILQMLERLEAGK